MSPQQTSCTQTEPDERLDNVVDLRDLPLAAQGRIAQRLLATRPAKGQAARSFG